MEKRGADFKFVYVCSRWFLDNSHNKFIKRIYIAFNNRAFKDLNSEPTKFIRQALEDSNIRQALNSLETPINKMHEYLPDTVHVILYPIKGSLYSLDFNHVQKQKINIETRIAKFLQIDVNNIYVGVTSNIRDAFTSQHINEVYMKTMEEYNYIKNEQHYLHNETYDGGKKTPNIKTGPRGGKYYIKKGRKIYIGK